MDIGALESGVSGPFVLAVPGVFSAEECSRIEALGRPELTDDGGLVGGVVHHNIRRADIAWLDDRGSGRWVMDRVVDTVASANRRHFHFDLTEFGERLQVAHYSAEVTGHYDWHSDIGDGQLAARRKLTMVVQLSDPDAYEGGALELNASGRAVAAPRRQGDAVLFASFVPHRVAPVTYGRRASLSVWIHGPAFR
ncbi:MAG: oxidoreductase [Hyphomicrobiales bacterium]|nr:MAG: oxidoreductase [Hyphomicrobiales bacterium]